MVSRKIPELQKSAVGTKKNGINSKPIFPE